MIKVVRLKRLLAILIALASLAFGMALVRALADTVLRSATGADPTSIFKDIPPVPDDLLNALAWLPDPERDGRPMEPTTRVLITDSYARALSALDRSGRGDTDAPLADYLSGPALETALSAIPRHDGAINSTFHLGQELRLDFYSDDGSVVAIGVPEVEIVRAFDGTAGRTITTTFEAWRFTMLLEDGNWRIQQLQTTAVEPPEVPGPPRPFDTRADGVNIVTVGGDDHTWTDVDEAQTIADLDAAAELGFGRVRVFIAGPEAEEIDVDAVENFLDLAAERGLQVVPVLFEDSPSHHQTSWQDDVPYLEDVVQPLADHEAIALWDLKNHPDLDEEASGGSVNVDAWLTRVASTVRRLDPDTPVTVGWSSHEHATRIVNWVDVVSFQYVDEPAMLGVALDEAIAAAGERPVVLSAFGTPEYRGRLRGLAPSAQATEFAQLLATVDRSDLAGAFVWTLRDPELPMTTGVTPGPASTSFGLLRTDGSERATAAVLRDGPSAIPAPTRVEQLRAQTVLLLAIVVVLLLIGGAVRARVRRRRYEKWESEMIEWLGAGMLPTRRGRIFRWRKVPIKAGRRGRILWWRRRQPWPAPDGEPIDPIAYIAEQVNRQAAEEAATDEPDDNTEASEAVEHDTGVPHEEGADDEDADVDDEAGRAGPAVDPTEQIAAAWLEGALTAMRADPVDEASLAWVDERLGALADADEPDPGASDEHDAVADSASARAG